MASKKKIYVILCLFAICALPVCSSAALPIVGFPLKPSPAEGPYQDDVFLEKANETIYGLSNHSVPSGTAIRELQSVQQQLAKMKISPKLYPVASDINAFLYYTGKAGSEYGDALIMTTNFNIPASQGQGQLAEAGKYYTAATEVWEGIKGMYPNVTLYTLSD
jgi:hypothetical protein